MQSQQYFCVPNLKVVNQWIQKYQSQTHALLLEAMNSLHANHGYSLMVRWNLPEKYCNIVRDHHNEEFDSKDMLQNLVRLADKACLKRGIGMVENPALVLVATVEADALHISEVDLAQMEIMLEDSQVMAN